MNNEPNEGIIDWLKHKPIRVYIAGPITGDKTVGDVRKRFNAMAEPFVDFGCKVNIPIDATLKNYADSLPLSEVDTLPEEIYAIDSQMISESDFICADITNPSTGVGVEIALARHVFNTSVILYSRGKNDNVSKFVKGWFHSKHDTDFFTGTDSKFKWCDNGIYLGCFETQSRWYTEIMGFLKRIQTDIILKYYHKVTQEKVHKESELFDTVHKYPTMVDSDKTD